MIFVSYKITGDQVALQHVVNGVDTEAEHFGYVLGKYAVGIFFELPLQLFTELFLCHLNSSFPLFAGGRKENHSKIRVLLLAILQGRFLKGAWRQGISSCSFLALLQKISKIAAFLPEIRLRNRSAHEPLFYQGLLAQSLENTRFQGGFSRDEP